jgi:glyoxylase-like metal-dependent hydrolase (beta-lactamase superfamily II)
MYIKNFIFNDFQENTYVLYDDTKQCVIVDPGCYTKYEEQELANFIEQNNLQPVKLINTHCHIDHVLGNAFVAQKYNLSLNLHKDELQTYRQTARWADVFGLVMQDIPANLVYLNEGDTVSFGNTQLEVLFTPGHSIGSLTFVNHAAKIIMCGDVLFNQSIGRTDLPGGNHATLIKSIKEKLLILPNDYVVYSGHGVKTTIGNERAHNPFLN